MTAEVRRVDRGTTRPPWPETELEELAACTVCGGQAAEPLHGTMCDRLSPSTPGSWSLVRCVTCGTARLDPRPTPESISLAYADAAYYTHEAPSPADSDLRQAPSGRLGRLRGGARGAYLRRGFGYDVDGPAWLGWLIGRLPLRTLVEHRVRHLPRPPGVGRLLDVGCGNGRFVAEMRSLGWNAEGIDPDPMAVEAARASGLPVRLGSAAQLHDVHGEGRFDAVTMSHVVEHVHDPLECLESVRRVLKPGGRLWIATPNLHSLGHRLFGSDWLGLDPPRHLTLFTPASLRRVVQGAGFTGLNFPRPVLGAIFSFRASDAIARGHPLPLSDEIRPSSRTWLRALAADAAVERRPQRAEEIVLTAHAPAVP